MLCHPSRFMVILTILGLSAMATDAQEKADADSPAAQFAALQKDFDKVQRAYLKRLQSASGVAEQGKIFRDENPQPVFAARFLELAKKHPNDPVAYAALRWIVQTSEFGPAALKPYAEAGELLAARYTKENDLEEFFERMAHSPFASSGQFLRTVFEKHASPAVRGRAGFHWALHLKNYGATVGQLRTDADFAANVERFVGPELFARLKNADTAEIDRKTEALFVRIQKDHALIVYKKTTLGKAAEAELFEMRNLAVGKAAPDIAGEDTDGKKLKLSDYRGKVVLLVFWGTWCPHCVGMFPQERALVQRFDGQPFAIVGVNSDSDRDKLKPFFAKQRVTWRSFWDGGSSDGPIATRWNVQGWPAVYVLDAKGVIRFKNVRGEPLDRAVNQLMKELAGG